MINEERIKMAAEELSLFQLHHLTDQTMEQPHFSRKFERKMKRLIEKNDHPVKHLFINIAAVFVAVILTVWAFLAANSQASAADNQWKFVFKNDCITCSYNGGVEAPDTRDYMIADLPKGYELIKEEQRTDGAIYTYLGPKDEVAAFLYFNGSEQSGFGFTNPGLSRSKVSLGENTAYVFTTTAENRNNAIIWVDEETKMIFMIFCREDQETLVQMAQRVVVKE